MIRRSTAITAAAISLALPALSRAQDLLKPAPVAVSLPWQVNCHGLSGIPLTADAVQALPLKLVATLSCGQGVALLSDAEGYTVNIRTADGKSGYVASMFLMKAPPAKPAPHIEPVSASTNNGVARWRPGAKGCDQFTKDGLMVESLTANGVTVQVSLQDIGSQLKANVAIGNFSTLHVYVDPIGITLEGAGPHGKSLANRDQHAGASAAAVNADLSTAEFAPVFAPVYAVQKQPVEDLTRPQAKQNSNVSNQLGPDALKKGSLRPDGRTWGAVWFLRDANPSSYVMRVPIDDQIFEFPLSLNPSISLNR
jgi:hypothetical protein